MKHFQESCAGSRCRRHPRQYDGSGRAAHVRSGVRTIALAMLITVGAATSIQSAMPSQAVAAPSAAAVMPADGGPVLGYGVGDSYLAGEGNHPYEEPCHRSFVWSAPALLAAKYSNRLAMTNLACTGATSEELITFQVPHIDPKARLVVLMVGGDDVEFGPDMTACVIGDCSTIDKSGELAAEGSNLDTVFSQIHRQASNATVFAIPYPPLVGNGTQCPPWLSPAEQAWIKRNETALNGILATAAARAVPPARVVGGLSVFANHDLCSPDSWFWPVTLNTVLSAGLQGFLHPTPAGQAALGALLEQEILRDAASLLRDPGQVPGPGTGEVPPTAPPPAPDSYSVSASLGVNVRSGPNTTSAVVHNLAYRTAVRVICQTMGEPVQGSPVWDAVAGGYVADYYLSTPGVGVYSPGLPTCDQPGGPPTLPPPTPRRTQPATGTLVCSGDDLTGTCITVTQDNGDIGLTPPGSAGSVWPAPGQVVRVYQWKDAGGACLATQPGTALLHISTTQVSRAAGSIYFGAGPCPQDRNTGHSDAPLVLCNGSNWAGTCAQSTTGISDLTTVGLNDAVTSLRVPPGHWLCVYEARQFAGRAIRYTSDAADLTGSPLAGLISSVDIDAPDCQSLPANLDANTSYGCSGTNFTGCVALTGDIGQLDDIRALGGDRMQSFRPATAVTTALWSDAGMQGLCFNASGPLPDLSKVPIGARTVSSVQIGTACPKPARGDNQILWCQLPNLQGRCVVTGAINDMNTVGFGDQTGSAEGPTTFSVGSNENLNGPCLQLSGEVDDFSRLAIGSRTVSSGYPDGRCTNPVTPPPDRLRVFSDSDYRGPTADYPWGADIDDVPRNSGIFTGSWLMPQGWIASAYTQPYGGGRCVTLVGGTVALGATALTGDTLRGLIVGRGCDGHAPPTPSLDTTPTGGAAPLTINLSATDTTDAAGQPITNTFDCGNGQTVQSSTAACIYPTPGTYTVKLTSADTSGFSGPPDTIIITVTTNQPPSCTVMAGTLTENTSGHIPLAATDAERDALTITPVTPTANLTLSAPAQDGTIVATPSVNWTGTTTVAYQVDDHHNPPVTCTTPITVVPVNQPALAGDDQATTAAATAVTTGVTHNDADPEGGALTVHPLGTPRHGSVTVNPDNTMTYTPQSNFTGTDTAAYSVTDPAGATATAVLIIDVGLPAPPLGVSAAPVSATKISINWNAVTGATKYQVLRSTTPDSGYTPIAKTAAVSFNDSTAAPATNYYYVVRTVSPSGTSLNSNEVTATTYSLPVPPTNLSCTALSATKIRLTWAPVPGGTRYQLLRSITSGGGYALIGSTTATSFIDARVSSATTYYYVARTATPIGSSQNSAEAAPVTTPG